MLKRNAHLYYSRLSSYYHGRVWILVRDITKDLQNTWSGVCMLNCQLLLSQQKGRALADIVHHHRDLRDSKQVLIRLMISAEGLSEKQSWLRALCKNTGRLQLEKKKKRCLTYVYTVFNSTFTARGQGRSWNLNLFTEKLLTLCTCECLQLAACCPAAHLMCKTERSLQ